jgi:thiopeptide-type bacteriocin biosynthesis protein
LTSALRRDPAVANELRYFPNSSLHRIGDTIHYVESRLSGTIRTHHLVKVEADMYLNTVLDRAESGAPPGELADQLVRAADDSEITRDDAVEFVKELIDNEILVPSLSPLVTGRSAVDDLISQLDSVGAGAAIGARLRWARERMREIDEKGIGVSPAEYDVITSSLEELPATIDPAKLYQIDLMKPVEDAVLAEPVMDEVLQGLKALARLGQSSELDEIKKFRERFLARYDRAKIPLMDALDEETGVGFGPARAVGLPTLRGLALGSPAAAGSGAVRLPKSHNILLRKLVESARTEASEIVIGRDDLPGDDGSLRTLPESFALNVVLVADSAAAIAKGDFRLVLKGGVGPNGARFFGRFCHADADLDQYVRRQLRQEEEYHPEATYAEIVYLPEGRMGNVLCRPLLRDYEIVYLGRSGASQERQLSAADLLVAVEGDRIVLYSKRLERRIIPRLTNAHGFMNPKLPSLYRFLCYLQHQDGVAVPGFFWGPLDALSYLPRVVCGRTVLSVARWKLNRKAITSLVAKERSAQFYAVSDLRRKLALPRWVVLEESDNTLAVDLENPLSVDAFVHVLKRKQQAVLLEMYPPPTELCATGPEGAFYHELNIPMFRPRPAEPSAGTPVAKRDLSVVPKALRLKAPGSDWLYIKLYGGVATLDEILAQTLGPIVRSALTSGAAAQWFFIRYSDPQEHLRIRFHGRPDDLREKILPAIFAAFDPIVSSGRIWKMQLDTYEREIERYGGLEAAALAERIFFADSQAVVEILEAISGEKDLDLRWRVGLLGIDGLLTDFGLDLDEKLKLAERLRDVFHREFGSGLELKRELGDRFRKHKRNLETLMNPAQMENDEFKFARDILGRRAQMIRQVANGLPSALGDGNMAAKRPEFLNACVHLHVNRLMRSSGRQYELVLYDFLSRIYDGKMARARALL